MAERAPVCGRALRLRLLDRAQVVGRGHVGAVPEVGLQPVLLLLDVGLLALDAQKVPVAVQVPVEDNTTQARHQQEKQQRQPSSMHSQGMHRWH